MSSLPCHACSWDGKGWAHLPQVTQNLPSFFAVGTRGHTAKNWPGGEVPGVSTRGTESRGCGAAGNQGCVRIPPTSAPSKRLVWRGFKREGEKGSGEKERREERGKEEREGKRAGTGEHGRQGHPAHPLEWECSELRLLFLSKREEKWSPPLCSCY